VQLLEVVNMITRISGAEHNLRIGALPFRNDETFVMKPNVEKLLSLGWKEKYSLEEGLREVMK
jgi:nucleoside-diphosphate-sugar epimerase